MLCFIPCVAFQGVIALKDISLYTWLLYSQLRPFTLNVSRFNFMIVVHVGY